MSLSISTAWDETKAAFKRDGRLISIVALALIGLPTMISTLIEPGSMTGKQQGPVLVQLLTLVFVLLSLVGQLAVVRLALKPSVSVGGAIAHAARRMPVYFVSALLVGLALAVLCIPLFVVASLSGVQLDRTMTSLTPTLSLIILVIFLVALFLGVRMLMGTPVASAEQAGPVEIIRRSWALTKGVWWKLFGFLVMLTIGAVIVLLAVSAAAGTVVAVALGPIEPMSTSALVVGLIVGLINAAFYALFAVMLARIYVQLSGRDTVEESVTPV
ncbi:MAG: hypothetical protein ABIR63_06685 [Sphingomicrobium sp.]